MGPRATRNNAVLDLPYSVNLFSTLKGMCCGRQREVMQYIEHFKCISTGSRICSKCNSPVDHLVVHFWYNKADFYLASSLTLPVPNWWTAQLFLGILYASIQMKNKIYVMELKCLSCTTQWS